MLSFGTWRCVTPGLTSVMETPFTAGAHKVHLQSCFETNYMSSQSHDRQKLIVQPCWYIQNQLHLTTWLQKASLICGLGVKLLKYFIIVDAFLTDILWRLLKVWWVLKGFRVYLQTSEKLNQSLQDYLNIIGRTIHQTPFHFLRAVVCCQNAFKAWHKDDI